MTNLILLRHGIALPHGTPGMLDDDRPLTEEGEQRMVQIAEGLNRLKLRLDAIFTSPLIRARRTAEIAATALGLEKRLEVTDALRAGRSAPSIRSWVEARPEARMMIVGHDPNFSDLVGLLSGAIGNPSSFALKRGGMAAFRHDSGVYHLEWLAPPRLFRKLGG
jgi:phosphohistidine phosphatase